jgi:WD40 repeat protein
MELKKLSRLKLPMGVLDFDLMPDGASLYAATMDGVYRVVVDTEAHEKIAEHESWVSGVALVDSAERLVSAGYDGKLQFRRTTHREPERVVDAHNFWSWKMAVPPDRTLVASVSGQYLAGDEKYAPRSTAAATVKVFDARNGATIHAWEMLPPVQAVAFSPTGENLAAANLMGDIAVWRMSDGERVATWRTEDFTSWGIIKSHCYVGGIHTLMFAADGRSLYAAGMGPMRDPMAGNGRQLWQKFAWQESPVRKMAETKQDQAGEGLMETLALHPSGGWFVMAGRLRGGEWNAGLFASDSGERIGQLKTGVRITSARFTSDGQELLLGGMANQPGPDGEGNWGSFGVIDRFEVPAEPPA